MTRYISLKEALTLLEQGELVAIPTETVYGLAADITQDQAIRKIFDLKSRPYNHPLIVHIATLKQLQDCISHLPPYAKALIEAFWPGPLTLVLPKSDNISNLITAEQDSVGIRMPSHPVARELLLAFGKPLAAPSANRYESISPTRAEHVYKEFGDTLAILEGGPSEVGLESTIVDARYETHYQILRPGMISQAQIQSVIGTLAHYQSLSDSLAVSGNKKKHYSPNKPLWIFNTPEELSSLFKHASKLAGIVLHTQDSRFVKQIQLSNHPKEYAKNLYHALRLADASDCQAIAIEEPPKTAEWEAIQDKIKRASTKPAP